LRDKTERGRAAYDGRAWADAYSILSDADRSGVLLPEDLERLSTAAYLTGRPDEFLANMERAHHAWLESGDPSRAARAAFWMGLHLLLRGQGGPATGWFGRAQRLLAHAGQKAVEEGYLLIPVAEQHIGSGDHRAAASTAGAAAAIGDRFGDADLTAMARHVEGRALVRNGQVEAGLALLDEAMVAVTARELSPIATGLIYCSVIEACQEVYAMERAGEWTAAMGRWCGDQPQMAAFTGICLVHRSRILQLQGAWPDALSEAERACLRYSQGKEARPPAAAFYQQAEVHRLRGRFAAAEEAYRQASQWGCEPQPGLALLRLAEGRTDAAAAAIRRAVGSARDRLETARLLPACVEILLGAGDLDGARKAADELEEIARSLRTTVLCALADHARGAVTLAAGDAGQALRRLRAAREAWQRIDAPYATARSRELAGLACRALGDEDGARLELDAAREMYKRLGAGPDLLRVGMRGKAEGNADEGSGGGSGAGTATGDFLPRPLTPREMEVLRLVAAGKTNKVIAQELFVSERTVDRHVSNILSKLDVPSRAAATAFAYEHRLL